MTNQLPPTPAGEVAKRPLEFFWLADHSSSMKGQKIASLNQAIREVIPKVIEALKNHPEVKVNMRAIKFAQHANWHIGDQNHSIPLEEFSWPELKAGGITATAEAIDLLAEVLSLEYMPRRGLPPVCVLISDGFCTDPEEEYLQAIKKLNNQDWGKQAVRLAIAVGEESDYDEDQLLKFVSHQEIGVLKAHNPEELINYIEWASISVIREASLSKVRNNDNNHNVILTPPPVVQPTLADSNEMF